MIRGRCLPYEEQTGYHASAQLVRQAFGIFDSDAQHIARAKLDEGVTALLPARRPPTRRGISRCCSVSGWMPPC